MNPSRNLASLFEPTGQQFDVSRNIRQHFISVALAIAAVGLISGYSRGGMLTRR